MRDDFLEFIRSEQPRVDMTLVEKAYSYAKRAHEGQVRESGDPYIVHPCEVAKIICSMGMDASTMAAGLLHDVVDAVEFLLDHRKQRRGLSQEECYGKHHKGQTAGRHQREFWRLTV